MLTDKLKEHLIQLSYSDSQLSATYSSRSSVQNCGEKCKYVKAVRIRLFSRLLEIFFVPLQLHIPGDYTDEHVEMIKYFQLSGCVVCGLGLWTVLDRFKNHSIGLNNWNAAEAGWTCRYLFF